MPSRSRSSAERDAEAGIGRPGGILLAAVTAAIVFVIGQQLLPERKREEPPPPPPPVPAVAPPPTPTAPRVEAGTTAVVDASSMDATQAPEVGAQAPEVPATAPPPPPPPPAARAALDPQQKLEKDIARESWRKNAPDIRVADDKASIVIPLKGSIEGASSKVIARTRTVVVTLPKAAALNTLKFYKLGQAGFRQLRIDQEEVNADPAKGTTLKIVLAESVGPLVEIKDDFVRVTIPHKAAPPAAEKESAAPAAPATPDASARD